jgi:hypothetical protein
MANTIPISARFISASALPEGKDRASRRAADFATFARRT